MDLNKLSSVSREGTMDGVAFEPEAISSIDVQLLRAMWTSVADVSSMGIVPGAQGAGRAGEGEDKDVEGTNGKRLMLAGIGMEMFNIDLEKEGDLDTVGEVPPASERADTGGFE